MALYYVTGTPGAGKSTVRTELQRRGFTAYDTDDLAAFYDTRTGQRVTTGQTASERTSEWRKHHEWRIPTEHIEALAAEAARQTVFLCGVVGNDAEFWDKFARVFCLYVPPDDLKRRLTDRADENAHGKNAHELATTLEWAAAARGQYANLGAVIIDATQPPSEVVNEILSRLYDND